MKNLLLILALLISLSANAQIDSLNYAFGYELGSAFFKDEDTFTQTEEGRKEVYRGVEENLPKYAMQTDSAYIVNYSMGCMQGVFFSDGLEHTPEDELPPVDCIITGLRMVADNQLTLPQDTIEAMKIIAGAPDSINPVQLPSDERCKFFTVYGILKGYPKDLKLLMLEYDITNIEPDYQYYAKGFADVLEVMMPPKDAYEFGRTIASLIRSAEPQITAEYKEVNVLSPDFLAGFRAALQLEPLKLTPEEMDNLLPDI